jgi:integrase
LTEARQRARLLLRDLHDGIDPREREAELLRAEASKQANGFRAVAEVFINKHVSRARTARAIELRIRRELIARWGDRPISDVSRRDVIAAIEEIVESGHPEAARQTLVFAKRLFGWAIARDIYGLAYAPTDRISARDLIGAKQSRQRLLTDAEIRLIWQATGGPYPDGPYVRLLLALGQRRNELARATWSEIDLDKALWTIGGDRMKAGDAHVVPLPAAVVDILRTLPRFSGSDIVFSASLGARPLNDFGTVKERLDRRIADINGGKEIAPWRFHDARRTMRTALSTLGVAPHVAELCIGHKQRGIVATYDLHRFELEKRSALERWAAHLHSIINPPPANVVKLAQRGG